MPGDESRRLSARRRVQAVEFQATSPGNESRQQQCRAGKRLSASAFILMEGSGACVWLRQVLPINTLMRQRKKHAAVRSVWHRASSGAGSCEKSEFKCYVVCSWGPAPWGKGLVCFQVYDKM